MRMSRLLVGAAAAALLVAYAATPAGAVWDPGLGGPKATGPNTDLTLTSTGAGQGVTGFIDPANRLSDPSVPYPTTNPMAPFVPNDEGFAGVINATPIGGGTDAADVLHQHPDVHVHRGRLRARRLDRRQRQQRRLRGPAPQRLLSRTNRAAPPLADDNQKAAAVQAAIWYFSDNYVLNTADPLHATVAAIVNAVRTQAAAGPAASAQPHHHAQHGRGLHRHPDRPVHGHGHGRQHHRCRRGRQRPDVLRCRGHDADPQRHRGAVSGTNIWIQDATAGAVTLSASAQATVPTGNVYLYDHNSPGLLAAQKLILAQTGEVRTDVQAQATLALPGSLTVTKTIGGAAAGQQGEIRIDVSCNGVGLDPFIIPAGTTGTPSKTYDNLLAGSTCTITETTDGSTATIGVVTVPAGPADDQPRLDRARGDLRRVHRGDHHEHHEHHDRGHDHPRHRRGRDPASDRDGLRHRAGRSDRRPAADRRWRGGAAGPATSLRLSPATGPPPAAYRRPGAGDGHGPLATMTG